MIPSDTCITLFGVHMHDGNIEIDSNILRAYKICFVLDMFIAIRETARFLS